ncbi:hypothetical protein [Poinsettia branch-inducing phytoplasma]|uniref:hypothetical protein n=1 Tax=Poinsettia branch-inducing phytoplasma TaxID=138647 RepID=UPI000C1FCD51|nr:hypothetical protein [Poinsettia branch-inducing phytoplasma]
MSLYSFFYYFSLFILVFFYNKEQKIALSTDKLVSYEQVHLDEYAESTDFNDTLDNKFQEKLDENNLTKEEEKQETFIIEEIQNEKLNTKDTTLNSDEEVKEITESKEKTKKNKKWSSIFGKKSEKNDKKDKQTGIIEKNSDLSEVEDKIQEEMTIQQEKTQ